MSEKPLPLIVFIGIGLIGGSWALALKKQGMAGKIMAIDRSMASLHRACELGVIDEAANWRDLSQADVIVLSVPVGAMEEVCRHLADLPLKKNCVITDTGSTKKSVLAAVSAAFGDIPTFFVPGHPVAGRERSGVEAANSDLFAKHRVILTPLEHTDPYALGVISRLWLATGALITYLGAQEHDEILAATSHLPHVLAYLLVDMLALQSKHEAIFDYSAGGFRDFTRVASSNPEMWRDVCLENQDIIINLLINYKKHIDTFIEHLSAGQADEIEKIFTRAKAARDAHYQKEQYK